MATLPSHTNILLGVSPLFHGIHDNLHFVVRYNFLTLAENFKAHGYATAAYVGVYPLDSRFGLAQGFDVYDDEYPHRYDPHLPYAPPEPFLSRFAKIPYDGEVAYVDMEMGKLIAFLKDQGLFDETMIVLTGDHGESLGQHGEMSHGVFAYNTTIWIPLIMKVPGISSRAVDQNVSHLDIFPTICDVCGIERPDLCQGTSLLPAMEGQKLADRTIYFESKYPYYSHGWAPLMGFIDRSEKFIDNGFAGFAGATAGSAWLNLHVATATIASVASNRR